MATTLQQFVQAAARDEAFVTDCAAEAEAMVAHRLRGVPEGAVPPAVRARAVLEAGADLYWRRSARNGIAAFDAPEGVQTMRIGRDPMASAEAVLRPYLGFGIA